MTAIVVRHGKSFRPLAVHDALEYSNTPISVFLARHRLYFEC